MPDFSGILTQLRAERAKLDAAIQAIEGLGGSRTAPAVTRRRAARAAKPQAARKGKSRISAAGRARIAAAARARWAAVRAKKGKAEKK